MARGRIIGGLGSPHAPSIGVAYNTGKHEAPAWKPLFDGYWPMQRWLEAKTPDLIIIVANDHANAFFFDRYPTFAMSVAAEHEIADEGWGKWPLPPVPGHSDFAWQLAHSLVDQEFDMAVCQEFPLDHGCLTPLTCFFPPERRWRVPVIPIIVNVLQPPIPSAKRSTMSSKDSSKSMLPRTSWDDAAGAARSDGPPVLADVSACAGNAMKGSVATATAAKEVLSRIGAPCKRT